VLGDFPDMVNWAALVQKSGLEFELACAGKTVKVAANRAVLRPDVWKQIFTPKTYVDPPKFPDYQKRLIVSYPVRDSLAYLKYAYQAIGTNTAPGGENQRALYELLSPLMFRDGKVSNLDDAISQMRVTVYNEQQDFLDGGGGVALQAKVSEAGSLPPDGVPSVTQIPPNTRDSVTRFAMFHHMPPAPHRPPLPKDEKGFAKTLDFHRALTGLSQYPTLLRYLGLVFDIEVPASFCPDSPSGGAYGTITLKKVTPGFKWKIAPKFSNPPTAYLRDKTAFYTAPATDPANLPTANYQPGDVIDGLLALTPDNYHLVQVDLDGALLKALALADNVAYVNFLGGDQSVIGDTLPALRSSGIGLAATDRALQLLQALVNNKSFDDALTSNQDFPRPLNVQDVVRGYRIDIHSSHTGKWHSLHRRNATYKFGAKDSVVIKKDDEEGFLHPAVASPAPDPTRKPDPVATANNIPQPGTDLYTHERMMRWEGWSLSAPRPGRPLNRSGDPTLATQEDPTINKPLTPFKMDIEFQAVSGSLPELRFGTQYKVRARAVDLAGNSVSLKTESPDTLNAPADGVPLTYMRFDPVGTPLVVLQKKPGPGASLETLVIRSYNSDPSLDTLVTLEVENRHIAPPRSSTRMAEQHGELDNAFGHLRGDAGTYNMIVARDSFEFPKVGKDSPIDANSNLKVQYLPDPIARGAALRDLPQAPGNTNGKIKNNSLNYYLLPDVQPRAGSVTFIEFGSGWPERKAFRLTLVEGSSAPKWDSANRVLTVSLPKSGVASVELSSYLNSDDLDIMGVWGWLREIFDAQESNAMTLSWAGSSVTWTSDMIALLTRLVLEGGHEMITPSHTLTLIHAVQQPIGRPEFEQLPVVHQKANPIFASALRNYFTPITAWRTKGSHTAVLLGGLLIHGASSSRIDLQSRWQDPEDDLSQPGPTRKWQSSHVEKIELPNTNAGPIYADISQKRMVAIYIPKVDTLWFAAAFDELSGVDTPSDVAAPLHRFDDTLHRWVTYEAVATSRFQEDFSDQTLDFTRTSHPLVVDVPSSARPLAPDIAYVVPAFGWEKQETSNIKSVVRFGNCLRVYLHRPWYSSGDDELLGVVLWPESVGAPDYATRETFKPYFTQWGTDPIWQTTDVGLLPAIYHFPRAFATGGPLHLEETSQNKFDVAGHQVSYDKERQLWYCDIVFSNPGSYCPFVRLALARYQTHSIDGVELSRVVLADYAQLTPDRSAVVTIDTGNPRSARVYVGGIAPAGPTQNVITVSVERRMAKVQTDLGWEPAPANEVKVTEDAPAPSITNAVLWSGSVNFAKTPQPGEYRIVIREFEQLMIEGLAVNIDLAPRLVYAAIVPYDYFPLGKQ
jgi:hypothetical protein